MTCCKRTDSEHLSVCVCRGMVPIAPPDSPARRSPPYCYKRTDSEHLSVCVCQGMVPIAPPNSPRRSPPTLLLLIRTDSEHLSVCVCQGMVPIAPPDSPARRSPPYCYKRTDSEPVTAAATKFAAHGKKRRKSASNPPVSHPYLSILVELLAVSTCLLEGLR